MSDAKRRPDRRVLRPTLAAGWPGASVARELPPRSRRVVGVAWHARAAGRRSRRCRSVARRPVPRQGQGDVHRAPPVHAAPVLPSATGTRDGARGSDRARTRAEKTAPASETAVGSAGRGAAGGARRRIHAGPARSRDDRNAVCDRPPRVRAGRAQDRPGGARQRRGARDGQGQQGAARPARRRSGGVAAAVSQGRAARARGRRQGAITCF